MRGVAGYAVVCSGNAKEVIGVPAAGRHWLNINNCG